MASKGPSDDILSNDNASVEKRSLKDDVVATADLPSDGDEALKLVGKERTVHFSEEYNAKLRRKLVSILF